MLKKIKYLLLLLPCFVSAQDFSDSWEGYYSYYQIKDIAYAGGKVYAAAENAVFSYQIGTGATEKFSSIQGLSGETISEIYYSDDNEMLLIGYENGLIEILRNEAEEVLSIIDIFEKQTISPGNKTINHFFEYQDKVYISTGYGISVYDLANLEFGETFFIGDKGGQLEVRQTTVLGDRIYAATENGLLYANVKNSNLVDFHQWNTFSSGNWTGVVAFQNKIYASRSNDKLYRLQGNGIVLEYSYNQEIRDLRSSEKVLILTTANEAHVYDEQLSEIVAVTNITSETLELTSAAYFANRVYLGHLRLGLLEVLSTSPTEFSRLSPNGPLMNRVFDMTAIPDELWVVYGEYDKNFNPTVPINERGLSHLKGTKWFNSPYEEVKAPELSDVAIDPQNRDHVFVSSYYRGLLEFNNGELTKTYYLADGLEEIPGTNGDVRIEGLAFHENGNLYMTNSQTEHPLKRLTPNGQIQIVDVSKAYPDALEAGSGETVVGPAGNVYFGTVKSGIICHQPSTNTSAAITSGTPGVDFPDSYHANPVISALKFDENGQLWIGTDDGLRVAYNPAGVFQEPPNVSVEPIIFLEGDVAQELFFQQYVTDIAVDGANNKWIATGDTGIFYVSSNGQKTIYHFTEDNSPLPSNSVRSVEIDEVSGEVYIGTTRGLVSFRGTATQGEETLANVYVYPNPVRPGYEGLVTIAKLTENANVKITDIEGNLVYETTSDGGNVQWDTTAFGNYKVASGVYLVLITSEDQLDTKISKIMIVR